MQRFIQELKELSWTLAGTGLVLITLSGQVRTYGLWISGGALFAHIAASLLSDDD